MMKPSSEDLRGRRAPIEMSADEFREAGHRLVDDIAEFIGGIRDLPVARDVSPGDMRELLPQGSVPEHGADGPQLVRDVFGLLRDNSLFNGHPRFFGYVTSSAAPIGALADLAAAALNPNVGGWQLSPLATEIEKQCVGWIADMIGFPSHSGLFVSGGNVSNFVCFLAARHAKAPWDVRTSGMAGGPQMLIYASPETHTWIEKAVDLFGLGSQTLREIPLDGELRADVTALRAQIDEDRRQGHCPFLIIGTAGTVSTGAIDPLPEMAAIARDCNVWFHVDGAYGGLAAVLPDAPHDLLGLREADSVAVDPHKWLYSPLEAGCALVRDPDALQNAFGYKPPYYHFESEDEPRVNFHEYGLQNSRGFRALKTWLSLRQVGRSGYVKMIGDDIELAHRLYRVMESDEDFEAVSCSLSVTTFRYVPMALATGREDAVTYIDELNEAILMRVKTSGETFLSNAVVSGRFVLRTCIVNFRTALEDIEALPDIVRRHGREIDREMRPSGLVS